MGGLVVVQSLSCVRLFATPWTVACQAPLSSTTSWNLLRFRSIESVVLSNHLIFCHPLRLLASIFPSIRIFSNEFSSSHQVLDLISSISPSSEYLGLISFRMDWFDLLAVQGLSRVLSSTTVQKHQFFGIQPSLWSNSHIHI